jgi:hypothetical protein
LSLGGKNSQSFYCRKLAKFTAKEPNYLDFSLSLKLWCFCQFRPLIELDYSSLNAAGLYRPGKDQHSVLAVKIGCSLSPTAKYSQSAKLIIGTAARPLIKTSSNAKLVLELSAEMALYASAGIGHWSGN